MTITKMMITKTPMMTPMRPLFMATFPVRSPAGRSASGPCLVYVVNLALFAVSTSMSDDN